MYKLVGTDGTRYYSWELQPGSYTLGRSSERDFCISHATVSRRHAEIRVADGGREIFLTDLGSHNGTTVNGNPITNEVRIGVDDAIMFGGTEFRLAPAETDSKEAARPGTIELGNADLEKSVMISIDEALKPLPARITDLPELMPALFDTAKMLATSLPEEELLQRALESLAKIVPAERLAVLFASESEGDVYPAATLLPKGNDPGEFTLSRTIVKEVLTNRNSVLIGDPRLDPRFSQQESIIQSALKSAMAVPLYAEGEVLGILYVDTTNPLHLYSDEYLKLLATFGNIIASRLSNNALLRERQEKEIMEAELNRAAAIQKSFLPPQISQIENYQAYAFQEPSRQVGGDLYDLALLEDGSLLFLVADVSGKGMGAALLMSNILAGFRILYHSGNLDLLAAVESVSRQMCQYSQSGDFATLFIGVLNPDTNEIRYVNAGHNAPLLVRADGNLELLEASGVMIGAFDFASWQEQTVKLEPYDLLFVFTDGVTEAETAEGDMYSDERTEQFVKDNRQLTAQQLADKLVADITEFVAGAPSSDDVTMLILKRDS